jgi:ubiquitin-protein ligase
MTTRLQSEILRLSNDLVDFKEMIHSAGPVRDNLFHWTAVVKGPAESSYQG